jgi:accessory gene regulator protein AgrB
MKYLKFLTLMLVFGVTLAVIYVIHSWYFKVDVVFYSAIADGVLAAVVTLLVACTFKWFRTFTGFEKLQSFVICLLLGYGFAISVPTVIDRSLSMYILEKLQQRGGGIQLAAFDTVFKDEYMKEHRLVDIRLTEQRQSGTIVIENGCVKLTEWGQFVATTTTWFRQTLLPKNRLIGDSYSSDLTSPLRSGVKRTDYLCQ